MSRVLTLQLERKGGMGDPGDMGLALLCQPALQELPTVNLPRFQSSSGPLKTRSKVIFDPAGM